MTNEVNELTFEQKFSKNCDTISKNMVCNKYNFEREYVNRYKFKTKNSSDIKYNLLIEAEKCIDRNIGREELQKYIVMEHIVDQIEKGLFEFSLIHVTINKLQYHFVENTYMHKLNDLCVNLNPDNEYVENFTLLPNVIDGILDVYYLAFFSYDVLHPKKWADIHLKKEIQHEAANNLQTTDVYRCNKCGEKKMKVVEIQLRSADESSSKVLTCMVCFKTFII